MQVKNSIILFMLLIILASSCRQDSPTLINGFSNLFMNAKPVVSIPEYKIWYSDNKKKLEVDRTIDKFNYIIKYIPTEVFVLREIKNESSIKNIDSLRNMYSSIQNFVLIIENSNFNSSPDRTFSSSYPEYDELTKYLSFDFDKDIVLIQDIDTISCKIFHFEHDYEIGSRCVFNIGFDSSEFNINEPFSISVNNRVFSNGIINFSFEPKMFTNIPKIEI